MKRLVHKGSKYERKFRTVTLLDKKNNPVRFGEYETKKERITLLSYWFNLYGQAMFGCTIVIKN